MKLLVGAGLLAILPILAFAGAASAMTFRSGDATTVSANEKIDGTAWLAGPNVDVAGEVDGDVFCAGQSVTISGRVDGDVICAGQTVTITGVVTGDVRVAGQTVLIGANVDGSVTAAGQTVQTDSQSQLGRDVSLAGQNVTVNGHVERDLAVGSAMATINAAVGRDVDAMAGTLTLGAAANIAGDVNYTSPQKLSQDASATVGGKVAYTHAEPRNTTTAATATATWFGVAVVLLLMIVASGILLALLFPREFHAVTTPGATSFTNVLIAGLVGLVAGLVMPGVLLFIAITVIGIPFAVIMGVAWLLVLLLAGFVTAYYLGRVLWPRQHNAVLSMFIGTLIISLLLLLPVINVLTWLFCVWYGSGAILLRLKKLLVAPHYTMQPVTTKTRK